MKDELNVSSSKMLPSRGMSHPLHLAVANAIKHRGIGAADLYCDPACDDSPMQRLPLFRGDPSRSTALCNVDLLVIKDDTVRAIIEIEESVSKPTTICGKFLTSALADRARLDLVVIPFSELALFVQVIDTHKLPPHSKKPAQYVHLKSVIQSVLPTLSSCVKQYQLFCVAGQADDTSLDEVAKAVALACNA
jgi:hypothetical protein